jgi:hypothetical protein
MRLALPPLFILAVILCPIRGESFTLQRAGIHGWSVKDLVVNINYVSCSGIARSVLDDAIDESFDLWNSVSTSNMRLIRGSNTATTASDAFTGVATDDPVIVCDTAFGATTSTDANQVFAVSDISSSGSAITYGFMLLNAQVGATANISNLSPIQFTILLAHEIGHVLGLGHTGVDESLMYYDLSLKTHLRLSQDDVDGVSFLYSRSEPDEDKVFGCARVGAGRSGPISQIWITALLLSLCQLWFRRNLILRRFQKSQVPVFKTW